jgi:protocatechuate 3,4-dioxygenase, alpha subunit
VSLKATPSQTVGPFFSVGLARMIRTELASPGVAGERVTVEGRLLDGNGPVPDGFIEIWQANALGKYAHPEDTQDLPTDPAFRGYGRVPTGPDGGFRFATIKPGPVPGPHGIPQAPHLVLSVFARGLMRRLITRMYFPEEAANARDFALSMVEATRRGTLIAARTGQPGVLAWNIVLQGPRETVFFDC